jgi:hypothetical protein
LKGGNRKCNRIGSAKADNVKAEKIAEKINASLALGIFDPQTEKPKPIPFDTCNCLFSIFVRRVAPSHTVRNRSRSRRSELDGVGFLDFPVRRNEFPVPDYREFVAITAERLVNLGPDSLRGA